jgi:hypothetical protein
MRGVPEKDRHVDKNSVTPIRNTTWIIRITGKKAKVQENRSSCSTMYWMPPMTRSITGSASR